ncbi:MAG TPA: NAD(P)/FAD-dependent oxidoreductase [Gemmatimonadaceae bacterium]|nr:NAD(P)/FAD-dependent oxidoreductase [Gemmatimonadaceae bacterium]
MARTPLFRLVRRSLLLAQQSLHGPLAPDELVERAAAARLRQRAARDGLLERPVSRRDFLAATAAMGAVAALDACAPRQPAGIPPAQRERERPVVIVGAGIAGLTAAHRLRQAGVPARVFEAQSRVGGRMYSLRGHFPDGQVVELGGELIDTGHERIRALAAELDIALDDLATDDPALAHDVWWFGGQRRTDAEVVTAFRPIAAAIERDLSTLQGDGDVTYDAPKGGETLDRLSIAQWLDRAGASGWIRTLLEVGYTTEFGLEPGEQSALNLLTMIGTEPDEFRIFGESDERFHVREGNDRIPLALAERLSGAIETGHVLEAVTGSGGGYVCTFRRGAATVDVPADQVLLAIPFTLLREVSLRGIALPPAKRRAIAELGYGTNAKLMIGFTERVWRTRHGSNGSTLADLPYQLTWETSRLQSGASGVLTNFTGGRHGISLGSGTAAEQAALTTRDLERVFPGVQAARASATEARFHWPSFPWTKGSYASYRPGQWTALRGAEGEPVGNLHFAGEHCSLAAQGFMEGGCETGERAAEAILAARGVRRSGGGQALSAQRAAVSVTTSDGPLLARPRLFPWSLIAER